MTWELLGAWPEEDGYYPAVLWRDGARYRFAVVRDDEIVLITGHHFRSHPGQSMRRYVPEEGSVETIYPHIAPKDETWHQLQVDPFPLLMELTL